MVTSITAHSECISHKCPELKWICTFLGKIPHSGWFLCQSNNCHRYTLYFWKVLGTATFKWHSIRKNHKTEKLSDYKATLESIANYNESTTTGLLKFAHPKNDKTQREAATVKIKSFENWEQDLIDILGQKNLEEIYVYDDPTYFVYAFLDGNKMEHPEKFIQPIQSSLKVLNIRVGKSLDDPYNLELGVSDIELVCRVLEEQFKNYAKEFKPAMIKIQETLDIIPLKEKTNNIKNHTLKRTININLL